jgi:hypothetical protein
MSDALGACNTALQAVSTQLRFNVPRSKFNVSNSTADLEPGTLNLERFLYASPWTERALEPLKRPATEYTENSESDRATEHLLHQQQLIRLPE